MRLTRNERVLNLFSVEQTRGSYYVKLGTYPVGAHAYPTQEQAINVMQHHQKWALLIFKSKVGLPPEEVESLEFLQDGNVPTFSTGICERLTCGYGELDGYGYWEFPLVPGDAYRGVYKYLRQNRDLLNLLASLVKTQQL